MASSDGVSGDKFQSPRGTRDFYGSGKRMRDAVAARAVEWFERYGFAPLETPAFENLDVLTAKFAGGDEILKETYRFADQGGRELGLRYDLTVPLCRFIAGNPKLPMPFKRYACGNVWRDGPLRAGRYREFVQCDADTIGSQSVLCEAELLAMGCGFLESLALDFQYQVNSRKLLDGLLLQAGVPEPLLQTAILSIDKLEKAGVKAVEAELAGKGVPAKAAAAALAAVSIDAVQPQLALSRLAAGGNDLVKQGANDLLVLYAFLEELGVTGRVRFNPALARGLNYYTGIVFEAFLADRSKISSSLSAGGRYDGMVGGFITAVSGRPASIPAVGLSFGIDVICECLNLGYGTSPAPAAPRGVFVIPVAGEKYAVRVLGEFRSAGVNASIDLLSRGIGKNIEYAAKSGYAFAAIIGKKEADAKSVTLRNLTTGEEKLLPTADAIAKARG